MTTSQDKATEPLTANELITILAGVIHVLPEEGRGRVFRAISEHAALVAVAEAAKGLCDAWDCPHKFSKQESGIALRQAVEAWVKMRESGVQS